MSSIISITKKHETTNIVDIEYKQAIYSSTPITVINYVKIYITNNVKNKSVYISHITILVVADESDPINSILSRLSSSWIITMYKNQDSIPCNVKTSSVFNITFYDKYNNYILTILLILQLLKQLFM